MKSVLRDVSPELKCHKFKYVTKLLRVSSPFCLNRSPLSDEEWNSKPRGNMEVQRLKTGVPIISTPTDHRKGFGEKGKDETICRSKSAEGFSTRNKYGDLKNRLIHKSRIIKSPSAGTTIRYAPLHSDDYPGRPNTTRQVN